MSVETFLGGRVILHGGDCLDILATLPEASVDAVVTDPPYHFASIVKRFGAEGAAAVSSSGQTGVYQRASKGFMGKKWDGGNIAHDPETWVQVLRVLKPGGHLVAFHAPRNWHRLACAIEDAGFEIRDNILWLFGSGFPKSHNLKGEFEGWGTALKPAYEPIVLARKPLRGTVAENMQAYGVGAINIDGCRVATESKSKSVGRWPANIVHDGSGHVVEAFPEVNGQHSDNLKATRRPGDVIFTVAGFKNPQGLRVGFDDGKGSAARFFYSAKADAGDRMGSRHPTVKPVDLMRWLVRMVTPPGGTVLDPFAGTGTTGQAAFVEGFNAILIEREEEYRADIRRRMDLMLAGPVTKTAALNDAPPDFGPLFNGGAA